MAMTPLPPAPQSTDTPAVFVPKADLLVGALPGFVTEANALQADVSNKQLIASNAATTATNAKDSALASKAAAEAASVATAWVSGTTYAVGDVRYSMVNFRSFRRKTAGAGTTDPSLDNTNWANITGINTLIATATITSTIANIDFTDVFSAEFDSYTVEFIGMKFASGSFARLQFITAAGLDGTSSYLNVGTLATSSASTALPYITVWDIGSSGAGEAVGSFSVMGTASGQKASIHSDYNTFGYTSADTFQWRANSGMYLPTTALTGFRLIAAGTTFSSGVIRVYGHTK